jgi:molybdopterin-guanine dinucleotide biosynthesis protein A
MGGDKALLDFCGTRMIDVVTGKLAALTDRVVVVARRKRTLGALGTLGARIIEDETPFAGPLPALIAGLRATGAERNIVVACDMPFLNIELLRAMTEMLSDDVDAAVPVTATGTEPLHAAYRDCAVEPFLSAVAAGERSLRGALDRLRVRTVGESEWRPIDPEGRSFLNVNTPDEFNAAAALQGGS